MSNILSVIAIIISLVSLYISIVKLSEQQEQKARQWVLLLKWRVAYKFGNKWYKIFVDTYWPARKKKWWHRYEPHIPV